MIWKTMLQVGRQEVKMSISKPLKSCFSLLYADLHGLLTQAVSKLSTSLVIGLIDLALNIKIRTQNPFEHPIYTIQIIEMKVFQKALKNKYLQRRKFK